jgi:hypothetical protein
MDLKLDISLLPLSENPKRFKKFVDGWAAFGEGWAVHAPTKEQVLKDYEERVKFYKELSKRPDVIRRPRLVEN